jgi:hypothetical protein
MSQYITLLGAEAVENAGHRMSRAADTMSSAASAIASVMHTMQMQQDDFLMRLNSILREDRLKRGIPE